MDLLSTDYNHPIRVTHLADSIKRFLEKQHITVAVNQTIFSGQSDAIDAITPSWLGSNPQIRNYLKKYVIDVTPEELTGDAKIAWQKAQIEALFLCTPKPPRKFYDPWPFINGKPMKFIGAQYFKKDHSTYHRTSAVYLFYSKEYDEYSTIIATYIKKNYTRLS